MTEPPLLEVLSFVTKRNRILLKVTQYFIMYLYLTIHNKQSHNINYLDLI